MTIRLGTALHMRQLLLDHVEPGAARIARGRVGQAPVMVENVVHVMAHVVHLSGNVRGLQLLPQAWSV